MRKPVPSLSAKIQRLAHDCQVARQQRQDAQERVQNFGSQQSHIRAQESEPASEAAMGKSASSKQGGAR